MIRFTASDAIAGIFLQAVKSDVIDSGNILLAKCDWVQDN